MSLNLKKDVVYRFLNSMTLNWHTFLITLASNGINYLLPLTSESRINAIVVDDFFYGRLRSKNVELLVNVNDHASKGNKYKRGFRMLTLGWTAVILLFHFLSIIRSFMSTIKKHSIDLYGSVISVIKGTPVL